MGEGSMLNKQCGDQNISKLLQYLLALYKVYSLL